MKLINRSVPIVTKCIVMICLICSSFSSLHGEETSALMETTTQVLISDRQDLTTDTGSPVKMAEKKESRNYTLKVFAPLEITSINIPDALILNPYKTKLKPTGGSGSYEFTTDKLPSNLVISKKGVLSGHITEKSGQYSFKVKLRDRETLVTIEKTIQLNIVDYFPDDYEELNDNDFSTANTIKPGENSQKHNFNFSGDLDFIKLDLSDVNAGDVIKINTSGLTVLSNSMLHLFYSDRRKVEFTVQSGSVGYSQIIYECLTPGIYFVSVEDVDKKTGEYNFEVTNTGPKLHIATKNLPDALKNDPYHFKMEANDGSGNYSFYAENLPEGLSIDKSGYIKGVPSVSSGTVAFTVNVKDTAYPGIFSKKTFTLDIVDFFPDDYETQNDNDFQTTNTIKPGDAPQNHTFNFTGDEDFILLDLKGVATGDVIDIKAHRLTQVTNVHISLYDLQKNLISSSVNPDGEALARLIYECKSQGMYFIKVVETKQQTGDYSFSLKNTGPKVQIATTGIPDALKSGTYQLPIKTNNGSGNYLFNAVNLPEGLTIDKEGVISGRMVVPSGKYPFVIRVDDTIYPGIFTEKEFILKVVDFFPDDYETQNDNDFQTTNTIKPGDAPQIHTFNFTGDEDYILLDLSGVNNNDVIYIKTGKHSQITDTSITLYDETENIILSNDKVQSGKYSELIYECARPGIYFIEVKETDLKTGDYSLEVINTGQKLSITTKTVPDALKANPYKTQIRVTGGSGSYQFTAFDLPAHTTLGKDGTIKGDIPSITGDYPFIIRIDDMKYPGIFVEKNFTLKVVSFFPDIYEIAGDNDFKSINTLIPNAEVQEHTFNTVGDTDYFRLDLSSVVAGDLIKIESRILTVKTNTTLTLYNSDHEVLLSDLNSGSGNYSKIVFHCQKPGLYYLKTDETRRNIGDYKISMINTGQKLQITTSSIPDVLKSSPYNFRLLSTGGSSKHIFTVVNTIPGELMLHENGKISGQISSESMPYLFTVKACDSLHPENKTQKKIKMTVVDYYPDSYEINGDNNFQTTNTMIPGSMQKHNFNSKGDEDFIRLDLKDVSTEDVLIIESKKLSQLTDTRMTLYNSAYLALGSNENGGKGNYSKIVFNCKTPGIFYLKVENNLNKTGDYSLHLNNSGQQLKITTHSVPIAESIEAYKVIINATGASGGYVYSISHGSLPAGLSLDSKTGQISGNNKNWGTYTATVQVKDQHYHENNHSKEFKIKAYMGKKISGTETTVYTHYLSGTFSTDIEFTNTTASPGNLIGGTPNNLRYKIISHNIPTPRFDYLFNKISGVLKIKELSPLACKQYDNVDMEIEVEVKDHVYTNNTFIFKYQIPAKCLEY